MGRTTLFIGLLGLAAHGCSGPSSQLTSCQQDKDQLLATIRSQRDANRALENKLASLETRLDESEKELARRSSPGTRLSSRPGEESKLSWRLPGDSSPAVAAKATKSSNPARPGSLAALAARDSRIALDPKQGTATLQAKLAFESSTANLTAQDRRELDQVAALLKSKEAADLRVLVSGFAQGRPPKSGDGAFTSARQLGAARAQAVADYLDRHGIAEERLGVTGVGSRLAADSATYGATSSVQIILAEPDAPLVGWGNSVQTLLR